MDLKSQKAASLAYRIGGLGRAAAHRIREGRIILEIAQALR
jgi:hypothetical protein